MQILEILFLHSCLMTEVASYLYIFRDKKVNKVEVKVFCISCLKFLSPTAVLL